MSSAEPLAVAEDDGTCRFCLAGDPVAFVGGHAACEACVDDLANIVMRKGDTLRCFAPVHEDRCSP